MEGVLTEAHTTFTAQKATSRNSNSPRDKEANGGRPNGGPYDIHGPKGHLPK
jgi:hypothetical protein